MLFTSTKDHSGFYIENGLRAREEGGKRVKRLEMVMIWTSEGAEKWTYSRCNFESEAKDCWSWGKGSNREWLLGFWLEYGDQCCYLSRYWRLRGFRAAGCGGEVIGLEREKWRVAFGKCWFWNALEMSKGSFRSWKFDSVQNVIALRAGPSSILYNKHMECCVARNSMQ